ncbi:hypothetical protein GCM10010909_15970 [Acidocella aquatica]|uniref:Uncharacterized protein n=2 Tax=Acidocella aquatica TaxID=1922313 RepID=A0ABQ6A5H2_9PROT|nr:hypothetical protein GCM10010909_15970 [Acidocella aquatica]
MDDDTIIIIDGISTITWSGFLRVNFFEPEEAEEMRAAPQGRGEYHGGGGAAAEFHLTLLTHKVTEFNLWEVEKLPVNQSVLFTGLAPDDLTCETSSIGLRLGRAFALSQIHSGTQIRTTA